MRRCLHILFIVFSFCFEQEVFALQCKALLLSTPQKNLEASVLFDLTGRKHTEVLNLAVYQKELLQSLIRKIDDISRYHRTPPFDRKYSIKATRNALLEAMYDSELIANNVVTLALSDKYVFAKLVEHYLGREAHKYHPKTEGLIDFLFKEGLIAKDTGRVAANQQEILSRLQRAFPEGFILKPTSGWSSQGRTFFKDPVEIVDLITSENPLVYEAKEFLNPHFSDELSAVASGERFIIQSYKGPSKGVKSLDANEIQREFRTHTLIGSVVPGSTKGRWVGDAPDLEAYAGVVRFVQDFLDLLPNGLKQQQAWSFDVLQLQGGGHALIELNTNRGLRGHWSGSLHNPRIVGAYARYLENRFSWSFEGLSAFLLRHNLGNMRRFRQHQRATSEKQHEED